MALVDVDVASGISSEGGGGGGGGGGAASSACGLQTAIRFGSGIAMANGDASPERCHSLVCLCLFAPVRGLA